MKLCTHCRQPVTASKSRDFCSDRCREEFNADALLDRKKPFRKTTAADIEIAYQRALAAQKGAS